MPALTEEQRELVRAARAAAAEARAATDRLAAAGVTPPDDDRLVGAVGDDLARVVWELTEILASVPGVTVRDDQRRIPRSQRPSVEIPVLFDDRGLPDEDRFTYLESAAVKITITMGG